MSSRPISEGRRLLQIAAPSFYRDLLESYGAGELRNLTPSPKALASKHRGGLATPTVRSLGVSGLFSAKPGSTDTMRLGKDKKADRAAPRHERLVLPFRGRVQGTWGPRTARDLSAGHDSPVRDPRSPPVSICSVWQDLLLGRLEAIGQHSAARVDDPPGLSGSR
jgi:hypothetical protein